LLRRNVLAPIGGIASIRSEVIDDCALARAVKKNGGRIWMGLTRASFSLRGYGTFPEIRNMMPAPLFTQLRYSFLLLAVALAGLFVTFILPGFRFFPARIRLVPRQHRHLFDDRNVRRHGAVLCSPLAMGSYFCGRGRVLRLRHLRFRPALLARSRRPMEGSCPSTTLNQVHTMPHPHL